MKIFYIQDYVKNGQIIKNILPDRRNRKQEVFLVRGKSFSTLPIALWLDPPPLGYERMYEESTPLFLALSLVLFFPKLNLTLIDGFHLPRKDRAQHSKNQLLFEK